MKNKSSKKEEEKKRVEKVSKTIEKKPPPAACNEMFFLSLFFCWAGTGQLSKVGVFLILATRLQLPRNFHLYAE